MRRVSRPDTLAPEAWVTKAKAETQQAIDAYKAAVSAFRKSKKRDKKLEFTFKYVVYGDIPLRDALNEVYGYKCAYCESFFGATQPVAVEHYRPKGEVIEGTARVKPGYYWLAATWQNLLPSCTDCNSPRRQEMEAGKKVVRGKGNHFPLVPGSKRAKTPGKEEQEKRLLLHPELDEPEKHFEFLTEPKREGVIRPALLEGKPSPHGAASIEVYALDRPQLTQARAATVKRLQSHLRNTRNSERRHQELPNDPALKKEYEDNLADLLLFVDASQPYLAMARQIVRAELPGFPL
jgi:uncharacterized protein (TIGR02646 family)